MSYSTTRDIEIAYLCNLEKTTERADYCQRRMSESNVIFAKTFVGAMNV